MRWLGGEENAKAQESWDIPGSPGVETSSSAEGVGLILDGGVKIPHASWPKDQDTKKRYYCNKFNNVFKNGPH